MPVPPIPPNNGMNPNYGAAPNPYQTGPIPTGGMNPVQDIQSTGYIPIQQPQPMGGMPGYGYPDQNPYGMPMQAQQAVQPKGKNIWKITFFAMLAVMVFEILIWIWLLFLA